MDFPSPFIPRILWTLWTSQFVEFSKFKPTQRANALSPPMFFFPSSFPFLLLLSFFFPFFFFSSFLFLPLLFPIIHVVTAGAGPKTTTKPKIGRQEPPFNLLAYSCCYNKLSWQQKWWGAKELLALFSYYYIVVMNVPLKTNTMGRWSFLAPFCCSCCNIDTWQWLVMMATLVIVIIAFDTY